MTPIKNFLDLSARLGLCVGITHDRLVCLTVSGCVTDEATFSLEPQMAIDLCACILPVASGLLRQSK